jgi:hypothetical protein
MWFILLRLANQFRATQTGWVCQLLTAFSGFPERLNEPLPVLLNRRISFNLRFNAFSSCEPAPTSLENTLAAVSSGENYTRHPLLKGARIVESWELSLCLT